MRISINNFKGITDLKKYDLKPFTIVSGTNSGGKTSLLQLLLMLKQTLENPWSENPLTLNKPYVSLGKFKDIIYENNVSNELEIEMLFSYDDLPKFIKNNIIYRKIKLGKIDSMNIKVSFLKVNKRIYVQQFQIEWSFNKDNQENMIYLQMKRSRGNKYSLATNSALFFKDSYFDLMKKDITEGNIFKKPIGWSANIEFEKFFPYQSTPTSDDADAEFASEMFSPLAHSSVERVLESYFNGISYLGPLRSEPLNYYSNDDDSKLKIGNKGEFAAHILENHAEDEINYFKINTQYDDTIEYEMYESNLEEAVNYWICDVFKMAKKIKVIEVRDSNLYRIVVNNGVQNLPITHVGFGISQLLPIIVEGLIMKEGSTLILEQPEIHLHPRIQSQLFDFLFSLVLAEKNVIVETHSDHLITRLRRRVAEDEKNDLLDRINLTFIVNDQELGRYFKELDLTTMGTFDYWPEDFFDQLDKDIKAIINAQFRKRELTIEQRKVRDTD